MSVVQPEVIKEKYDVIVVGCGAAGGTAADVLTGRGLHVLMLEAGRMIDPLQDMTPHAWPWEYPFRGRGKPGQYDGLWKINEATAQLYTNPRIDRYAEAQSMPFHWTRLRAVGGRTLTWGRGSVRLGPLDFKTRSKQGFGLDWPISYEDLAPYYAKVERLIGVSGTRENLFNVPDGVYLPPLRPRCAEVLLRERVAPLGVPVATSRSAVLTRPHGGRSPCHYCASCWGCQVQARYSSLDVNIPRLLRRKNFTLRTNAAVHQVLVDREGRARGVSFIDSTTGKDYEKRARSVLLGASTVESCRILLNSRSRFHPNGLANSSGCLGRYILDSVKSGAVSGLLPVLKGRDVINEDGAGSHVFIPRFNWNRKNDYQGGYIIGVGSGFRKSPVGTGSIPGYGRNFKKAVRQVYGAQLSFRAYGERLPDYDNYLEIDPAGLTDSLGIPQVRFHVANRENDFKMRDDMYHWMVKLLKECDAEQLPFQPNLQPPGDATHESGGARMGNDPKSSVLNKFNQAHDVKNLFVADASSFVSLPGTNGITTTIMALAWRASEYLAEQMRTGAIG